MIHLVIQQWENCSKEPSALILGESMYLCPNSHLSSTESRINTKQRNSTLCYELADQLQTPVRYQSLKHHTKIPLIYASLMLNDCLSSGQTVPSMGTEASTPRQTIIINCSGWKACLLVFFFQC